MQSWSKNFQVQFTERLRSSAWHIVSDYGYVFHRTVTVYRGSGTWTAPNAPCPSKTVWNICWTVKNSQADECFGHCCDIPETQLCHGRQAAQKISIPPAQCCCYKGQSGLEYGHHLYQAEWRFCTEVLEQALEKYGTPEILNTDQGCQYTSNEFTSILESHGISISMDGKGRALDNIFVERLWRTVKYEDIYLKDYGTVPTCKKGLADFFERYNNRWEHRANALK